jgi:hypothetical protein
MVKVICGVAQVDVFGYKMLKESCFKKELRKNFKKYFDNLPRVTALVDSLNDSQWNEFFTVLMRATRTSDANAGLVETADIRTLVVVLHYADGLMLTYDKDGSNSLSIDEIYSAVPRFISFLRIMHPEYSDEDLADGFAYMLIYGKEPNIAQGAWFRYVGRYLPIPTVNHLNVLKVIEVLKDKLN